MRRVLAILLALTMMLSLTVSAAWADDPDPTPGTPVGTEEPANSDPAPANSGGGEETPTTPGNETPATRDPGCSRGKDYDHLHQRCTYLHRQRHGQG